MRHALRRAWGGAVAAALLVLAAAGCGATRAPSPGDTSVTDLMTAGDRSRLQTITTQRIAQQSDPDQGYRIGPDDLLEISIPDLLGATAFRGATLTGPPSPAVPGVEAAPVFRQGFRVSALGDIALPQLGTVPVAGLTARGLAKDLAYRLRVAQVLNNPEVTVTVVEHRSDVVAVIGSVERPGLYPLTRPEATISDLIWAAGGPNKDAGRIVQFTPATLPPPDADGECNAPAPGAVKATPIRIDMDALLRSEEAGNANLNAPVRAGDVINIAPAGVVLVDGWVQKPGSYPVTRSLTLTGTIAAAGGTTFPADVTRATLKRTLSPTEQYFMTVDLHAVDDREAADFPIIDGDIVYLPASSARLVPWGIYQFFANVFRLGASVVTF